MHGIDQLFYFLYLAIGIVLFVMLGSTLLGIYFAEKHLKNKGKINEN
jgi:hypothetical protein